MLFRDTGRNLPHWKSCCTPFGFDLYPCPCALSLPLPETQTCTLLVRIYQSPTSTLNSSIRLKFDRRSLSNIELMSTQAQLAELADKGCKYGAYSIKIMLAPGTKFCYSDKVLFGNSSMDRWPKRDTISGFSPCLPTIIQLHKAKRRANRRIPYGTFLFLPACAAPVEKGGNFYAEGKNRY